MNEMLDYTLFEIGEYSLTVALLAGIVFLIVAVRFTLFLIRKILFRYFNKKGVDRGRSEAIYSLITYFFWTVAIVAALEMLGIHVTFLIAGSAALLVGLGLGLQQVFQDLISGIFILIEGTIKVNDVIELDGMVGKVLCVNLRTSQVLTRGDIIIIVPNHKFINENITNWSHNSESTRFHVEVGVAYGSDVEKVKSILLACAEEHNQIIKDADDVEHNPFVRFIDFGDSALKFHVYFWTTAIFRVEYIKSDLRFAIDRKFREQGITIPFPQRDIHVKTKM